MFSIGAVGALLLSFYKLGLGNVFHPPSVRSREWINFCSAFYRRWNGGRAIGRHTLEYISQGPFLDKFLCFRRRTMNFYENSHRGAVAVAFLLNIIKRTPAGSVTTIDESINAHQHCVCAILKS